MLLIRDNRGSNICIVRNRELPYRNYLLPYFIHGVHVWVVIYCGVVERGGGNNCGIVQTYIRPKRGGV